LFGESIGNVTELEVPPPTGGLPVGGFTTVICAEPAVAMSIAGMVIVSCCVLTLKRLVAHEPGAGTQLPFQKTWEVVRKFVPIMFSVKSEPSAVWVSGKTPVMDGEGLIATVPLLLQLASSITMAASATVAAQRERINPCLL